MDSDYNVIANYKYDAYGKVVSITDNEKKEITDTNHIAYINPFRYRSYYYDEDTKLYYLNSRYYNPLFGRFINADRLLGPGNDLAYNLYLYCGNNPVSRVDEDGNWFFGVVAKGIKAVAKPALKAADKMVKGVGNCIGDVFGAGASVSSRKEF